MCKISNEIKLCSCSPETDFSQIVNRWELQRRKNGWSKIGETVFNANELDIKESDIENLLKKLNANTLFDFDFKAEDADKLEIRFSSQGKSSHYSFVFESGTWKIHNDFLDWFSDFEASDSAYITEFRGGIEKPFE